MKRFPLMPILLVLAMLIVHLPINAQSCNAPTEVWYQCSSNCVASTYQCAGIWSYACVFQAFIPCCSSGSLALFIGNGNRCAASDKECVPEKPLIAKTEGKAEPAPVKTDAGR